MRLSFDGQKADFDLLRTAAEQNGAYYRVHPHKFAGFRQQGDGWNYLTSGGNLIRISSNGASATAHVTR